MGQANEIQSPQAVAYRKNRPVDRLGPEALPHPEEIDFRQLRLEPYRLEIQRHGLPDIDHLWEPRQRVEVHGKLKAMGIARLRQEGPGPDGVVAVQLFEAPVPVEVPDPRPDGTVELGMVAMHPQRLHPPAQEGLRDGLAV